MDQRNLGDSGMKLSTYHGIRNRITFLKVHKKICELFLELLNPSFKQAKGDKGDQRIMDHPDGDMGASMSHGDMTNRHSHGKIHPFYS
jgi:hypothetical protein